MWANSCETIEDIDIIDKLGKTLKNKIFLCADSRQYLKCLSITRERIKSYEFGYTPELPG